jgi:hypothetical protein
MFLPDFLHRGVAMSAKLRRELAAKIHVRFVCSDDSVLEFKFIYKSFKPLFEQRHIEVN